MISSSKKDKNYNSETKNSLPFEEEIKRIIKDKISKDPDKFVEKMKSSFSGYGFLFNNA